MDRYLSTKSSYAGTAYDSAMTATPPSSVDEEQSLLIAQLKAQLDALENKVDPTPAPPEPELCPTCNPPTECPTCGGPIDRKGVAKTAGGNYLPLPSVEEQQ